MCVCYVTTLYFSYNIRWQEFLPWRWWLPKKEVESSFPRLQCASSVPSLTACDPYPGRGARNFESDASLPS